MSSKSVLGSNRSILDIKSTDRRNPNESLRHNETIVNTTTYEIVDVSKIDIFLKKKSNFGYKPDEIFKMYSNQLGNNFIDNPK